MFYAKTGWMMEWDLEVRYRAPIRSHVVVFVRMIDTMTPALRKLGISMSEAFKKTNEAFEKLEKYYG